MADIVLGAEGTELKVKEILMDNLSLIRLLRLVYTDQGCYALNPA